MWKQQLRIAVSVTGVLMVLTGFLYPGMVTLLAQVLFPQQANGSLIVKDGTVIGSELIGQKFSEARYFQGRPSAAGGGYDGVASAGTNKGPTDRKLADTLIADAVDSASSQFGIKHGHIPADLVTASASGLDPHISPASALVQIARVARARSVDSTKVHQVVDRVTENRQFGVLGEPRVNVLKLNLTLDKELPVK